MTMGWLPPSAAGRLMRGPLAFAAVMVDAWEESARLFWSFWGPFGEPVIGAAEAIAGMQRRYLAWLADTFGQFDVVS